MLIQDYKEALRDFSPHLVVVSWQPLGKVWERALAHEPIQPSFCFIVAEFQIKCSST